MAEPAKIVAAAWGRYPDISFLLLKAKDINRASLPAAIHEKLSLTFSAGPIYIRSAPNAESKI